MSKTFPRRRMAQVWALQVEVAMDDGSFVDRRLAERTLCKGALAPYLGEVRSGAVAPCRTWLTATSMRSRSHWWRGSGRIALPR